MLRSNLCDFSDAYIVVKGKITVTNPNNDAYDKKLALKNNAPFISCISKINNTLTGNAEDLGNVMSLYILYKLQYKLQKYSINYKKKQQALCLIITEMNKIVVQ